MNMKTLITLLIIPELEVLV